MSRAGSLVAIAAISVCLTAECSASADEIKIMLVVTDDAKFSTLDQNHKRPAGSRNGWIIHVSFVFQ